MKLKKIYKKTNIIVKMFLIIFVVIIIYLGNVIFFPRKLPKDQYQLIINKDQSVTQLATDLRQNHIIASSKVFTILLALSRKDRKVTAGLYNFKNSISMWKLIYRITNGHPDQISITIIDGWTLSTLRSYINGLDNVKHLTNKLTDFELKEALEIEYPSLEGVFYPSTYFIVPNQSDLEIYLTAHHLMQLKLLDLYASKSINTNYANPYQLLIMASLIQKETNNFNDMIMVSAVFNNRLKAGMKLQNDPAVFYGLKNRERVSRKDFLIDTPYNTYLRFGLPPTPICIPSYNALVAASKPYDNSKIFYFIGVGNKTKFSNTYKEHQHKIATHMGK